MARRSEQSRQDPVPPVPPAVASLGQALRRHLAGGGFAPGERYLSVRQAARRFAVSPVTAHQAFMLLANEGLLDLRPGSGAYVTRPPATPRRHRIVRVFLRDDPALRQRFLLDGLQLGLLDTLPAEVVMQLHFVPATDTLAHLASAMAEADSVGRGDVRDGVMLLRVGREARRFFHQRGLPTVALGTAEDDLNIGSVGHDQTQLGQMVGDLLVGRRRRHATLAMGQLWDLGDNQLLDSLQRRLESASPRVRLRVLSVPTEPELAAGVLRAAILGQDDPPTLLCRSGQMALQAAALAATIRGLPTKLLLVALGSDGLQRQRPAMPLMAPDPDDREVGQAAARLLLEQWQGGPQRQRVNLPQSLNPLGP